MTNALTKKINATIELIDQGFYEEALEKIYKDIMSKTNGCIESGTPDRNDWITDCEVQEEVYNLLLEATELLENLL